MLTNFRESFSLNKFLIFVSILVWIEVRSDSVLPIVCNQNKRLNECYEAVSHCNRRLGLCQCRTRFPIVLSSFGLCLDYRQLGQECLLSSQCSQTLNAICVNSDNIELKGIELINTLLLDKYYTNAGIDVPKALFNRFRKNIKLKKGYKSLGRCRCRSGHKPLGTGMCQSSTIIDIQCYGSHECLQRDMNSHCDAKSSQCYCDSGYVYDFDRDQCQLSLKKFGDTCVMHFECQGWHSNMECRYSQCFCQKGFDFDFITQRCKRCDESTGGCHPIPTYEERANEYHLFSSDKSEKIVIIVFCFLTIAVIRFWRNILPQSLSVGSQRGMFSDFTQTNRIQRRRTSVNRNILSRSRRVCQLRVNFNSPESQYTTEEAFVCLPLSTSQSSLPPYELTNGSNQSNDSQPPPYSEGLPTYEEAMSLCGTNETIK